MQAIKSEHENSCDFALEFDHGKGDRAHEAMRKYVKQALHEQSMLVKEQSTDSSAAPSGTARMFFEVRIPFSVLRQRASRLGLMKQLKPQPESHVGPVYREYNEVLRNQFLNWDDENLFFTPACSLWIDANQ